MPVGCVLTNEWHSFAWKDGWDVGFKRFLCLLTAVVVLFTALAAAEMLLPQPSGTTVFNEGGTTLDVSHADQGYIMLKQEQSNKKIKVRISQGKSSLTYDVDADGKYVTFPLQMGNGKYKVEVFSQVSGKKYAPVSNFSFKAEIPDERSIYLYPNQYVDYDENALPIAEAQRLCEGLTTDREKFEAIYQYVITHVVYDYDKARSVKAGYLPDVDQVYTDNKGICFDFSALMACMLRSQGISTKLVIGYADRIYHAWNEVYLDGKWELYDATQATVGSNMNRYTTERTY